MSSAWRRLIQLIVVSAVLAPALASAQNRIDLDDIDIKGELQNDNRLKMSSRGAHKITDRVTYRTGFRKEISDGLEIQWPEQESARVPAAEGRDR